jgi:hypothetical protein
MNHDDRRVALHLCLCNSDASGVLQLLKLDAVVKREVQIKC